MSGGEAILVRQFRLQVLGGQQGVGKAFPAGIAGDTVEDSLQLAAASGACEHRGDHQATGLAPGVEIEDRVQVGEHGSVRRRAGSDPAVGRLVLRQRGTALGHESRQPRKQAAIRTPARQHEQRRQREGNRPSHDALARSPAEESLAQLRG